MRNHNSKIYLIFILSNLFNICLRVFYLFPIRNKQIFFMSYDGKQFSCNPKYIYQSIINSHELITIWALNGNSKYYEEIKKNHTKIVKPYSILFFYYILTSKYVISNNGLKTFIPIRKNQIYLETWHGGGAYKKTGIDVNSSKIEIKKLKKLALKTTFFISSSQKVTKTKSMSHMLNKNKFLNIGTPRNDIFFKENIDIRNKVLKSLEIDKDKKIVLYAPTFRGKKGGGIDNNYEMLNVETCIKSLKRKFGGDWVFLFRAHHTVKNKFTNCINVSDYDDMQELLLTCDILISDYSSSMWDFSFTNKPCFVYAPDFENYSETRSFYTSPSQWPYSISKSNNELIQSINNFDLEKYKLAVEKHHKSQGSFENGKATEYICDLILGRNDKK